MLGADPLLAEIAVSQVLGVMWASDPRRDGSAEEAFEPGLVEYARQSHQPPAVALLRALAAVGTLREVRDAAFEAVRSQPVPTSDWSPAVGAVTIGRCWLTEDAFGDVATVLCEFGYGTNIGPLLGMASPSSLTRPILAPRSTRPWLTMSMPPYTTFGTGRSTHMMTSDSSSRAGPALFSARRSRVRISFRQLRLRQDLLLLVRSPWPAFALCRPHPMRCRLRSSRRRNGGTRSWPSSATVPRRPS